jgi:ferredoxin
VLAGALALAALAAVCGGLFARRARFLYRLVKRGKPPDRRDDLPGRVKNEAVIVLGQKKLLHRLVPGLMHAFIFWGFLVLFPTIVMAMIGAVSRGSTLPWLGHQHWFELLVDVFAVLVLVGVVTALVIRKIVRPARFEGSHLGEADFILFMIAGVVTTLLVWHHSSGALERVSVWAHLSFIFGFLAYLPHSKHLHIATAPINVWLARTRDRGRLEPLRFDVPEEEMRFGAATVADLTRKEVLDGMTCTECGRCQDACPAYATGKVLNPKLLIMGIRDQVFAQSPLPIVGNGVPEEMIWDCVTCGACVEATSSARRTRGASRRPSGRRGRKRSAFGCWSRAIQRPRSCTGSAAPPRSTSARASRPSRRRSSCRRQVSTSRSSARARRARAIPRGGWGTSTSSRRSRSRTCRRSTRRA